MLRFYAEKFCNLSVQLKWMQSEGATEFLGFGVNDATKLHNQDRFFKFFRKLGTDLLAIDCKTSAAMAERLAQEIAIIDSRDVLVAKIDFVAQAVLSEMSHEVFLWMPSRQAAFFNATEKTFADKVADRFPKALSEIRSAGNCYATDNPTACVFHLMRVMEIGLRAIYASLGLAFDPQASWGKILKDWGQDEIKAHPAANAIMLANLQFYQNARSTLAAVKDSWRNSTMHFDRGYDLPEAEEIMVAVRGFLKCVAEKMNENGAWITP
jgi:hypothetical protein